MRKISIILILITACTNDVGKFYGEDLGTPSNTEVFITDDEVKKEYSKLFCGVPTPMVNGCVYYLTGNPSCNMCSLS